MMKRVEMKDASTEAIDDSIKVIEEQYNLKIKMMQKTNRTLELLMAEKTAVVE
jgi:hypothetical protein